MNITDSYYKSITIVTNFVEGRGAYAPEAAGGLRLGPTLYPQHLR